MDITVNELTRRENTKQNHHITNASTPKIHQEKAFSNLSCSAVKVGEKRQRNQCAAELCNTKEQHSSRGSNDNGCAERGEEVCGDPKFNDFEKLREEVNFEVGQTWALYDDKVDGMPRLYARIRKVSAPTFEVRITYLEPDPDDEKQIQWHEKDLPNSAGQFKLGKHHNTTDRSLFSHVIHCKEGSNTGHLTVSPRKGEIWALFKNWDINWSSEPAYEYEFVEVLSDYADKAGATVAYLHKAKGFNEYDVVEILDDALDYKVLLLELQPVRGEEDEDEYRLLRAVKGSKYHEEEDDESEPEFTIPKRKRLRFSNKVAAWRVTREIYGELEDLIKVDARALPSCIRYPDF